jgi:AraC-like DNA-binding protein
VGEDETMDVTLPRREVITRYRTRSLVIGAVTVSMTRLPAGATVARPASASEPRSIQLLLPVDSALVVRSRESRHHHVGQHELVWLPNWLATAIYCSQPATTVWVDLPTRSWQRHPALSGTLPAHPARGSLLVQPVRAFVQSLLTRSGTAEPLSARLVEDLLGTMLGSLVLEARGAGAGPTGVAGSDGAARPPLHARAIAHIAAFRDDPGLSPQQIARSLRISVRQLQRSFEEAGTTVAAEIRRQRLDAAVRMLDDASFDSLTVAEVAARAGFRNDAELRRALAALAGTTPSTLRARRSRAA